MKIKYVNHGIGNRFEDVIEINENLKKYPELLKEVLKHELQHTDKIFTINDLKLDLKPSKINTLDILLFMLKYPKSFSQLLPFYFSRKRGFVYDINLILIYSVTISVISLITLIALSI